MKKINKLAILILLPVAAFAMPYVEETMTLANGWNAIYLESTPTNAVCTDFFAGAPVARVASYHSDAYSSTRQLADDGTEIAQKPISYHVWVPGDETASTLSALAGGNVYLIYATDGWSKTFLGVPAAPRQTWRATSGDTGFMNLAGVSADTNASVTAKAYFGEGPFGTSSGVAYQIGGNKTAAPTFLPMTIGSNQKLHGGMAYALTATKDGDWPGVIGVQGSAVYFGADVNYASITVRNYGTTNHMFRFTMERAASGSRQVRVLPRTVGRRPFRGMAEGVRRLPDDAHTGVKGRRAELRALRGRAGPEVRVQPRPLKREAVLRGPPHVGHARRVPGRTEGGR